MRGLLPLLCLLLLPLPPALSAAAAQPMLVGVAPHLPGGVEGFAIGANEEAFLLDWSVTDGEGTVDLPYTRLVPGQPAWFTSNETAWGRLGGPPARPWAASGPFRLSDAGEGLRLVDAADRAADAFAWGDGREEGMAGAVAYASEGLVYLRDGGEGGWPDTDTAADWTTPRAHRIGESRIGPRTFTVHRLALYSSPDSSHEVLSALVAGARQRLHLHVYEFGAQDLADRLRLARLENPGLDLQVLVDAQPVGMTATERHRETQALQTVQSEGGHVVLAGHGRYGFHHLKVLVADDAVAVQSENWVEAGVPADPSTGNRGWGVVIDDAAFANWMAQWMAADRAAWDARPFDAAEFDPTFEPATATAPRTGGYGPRVPPAEMEGEFRVTPLVAPDHTQDPRRDPLAALVDGAQRSVAVQQLDLAVAAANDLGWRGPDPLLEALARAAGRGVEVRAMAAPPFSGEDEGNRAELEWLAARGVAVATMDREGIRTLHNKGLVVDGRAAVVGSMNGNHHSRSANREVSLVLEGPGVAGWFQGLFDADWEGRAPGPDAGVVGRDVRGLPWAPLPSLLALAGVGAVIHGRRRR